MRVVVVVLWWLTTMRGCAVMCQILRVELGDGHMACRYDYECYDTREPMDWYELGKVDGISYGSSGCLCIDEECRINGQLEGKHVQTSCVYCGRMCARTERFYDGVKEELGITSGVALDFRVPHPTIPANRVVEVRPVADPSQPGNNGPSNPSNRVIDLDDFQDPLHLLTPERVKEFDVASTARSPETTFHFEPSTPPQSTLEFRSTDGGTQDPHPTVPEQDSFGDAEVAANDPRAFGGLNADPRVGGRLRLKEANITTARDPRLTSSLTWSKSAEQRFGAHRTASAERRGGTWTHHARPIRREPPAHRRQETVVVQTEYPQDRSSRHREEPGPADSSQPIPRQLQPPRVALFSPSNVNRPIPTKKRSDANTLGSGEVTFGVEDRTENRTHSSAGERGPGPPAWLSAAPAASESTRWPPVTVVDDDWWYSPYIVGSPTAREATRQRNGVFAPPPVVRRDFVARRPRTKPKRIGSEAVKEQSRSAIEETLIALRLNETSEFISLLNEATTSKSNASRSGPIPSWLLEQFNEQNVLDISIDDLLNATSAETLADQD